MLVKFTRNRTSTVIVMYSLYLYLYFLGLSLSTSKAIESFTKRSYVSIWNWIQMLGLYPVDKRRRVSAFVIDETLVQIGNKHT